ncbi:hypothetical protein KPN8_253 [Klebsiella phage KPN8]|nr:hypothetical protein KPN8_253 [Klebsiella phage KPN8]
MITPAGFLPVANPVYRRNPAYRYNTLIRLAALSWAASFGLGRNPPEPTFRQATGHASFSPTFGCLLSARRARHA